MGPGTSVVSKNTDTPTPCLYTSEPETLVCFYPHPDPGVQCYLGGQSFHVDWNLRQSDFLVLSVRLSVCVVLVLSPSVCLSVSSPRTVTTHLPVCDYLSI